MIIAAVYGGRGPPSIIGNSNLKTFPVFVPPSVNWAADAICKRALSCYRFCGDSVSQRECIMCNAYQ
ncbi:conserved hypothetical protein [Ricinus communis]|uniref:Uncharacterized protein n=1 Tax=Ricinus communis TaxID=3988 RepID=B9S3Z9_RICCO|nr:conserved hypothetical protein [Ricinus communis]